MMTRFAARSTTAKKFITFGLVTVGSMPIVEITAMYFRDRYYWPLVRELYLEVKNIEKRR